jgi:hypothetical protein
MAATGSVLASALAALGSTFPDRIESLLWKKGRPRHHRRTSHWFVFYAAGFVVCFYVWGDAVVPRLLSLPDVVADHLREGMFSCAAFWFLGGFLHVFCDAFCGRVPLLVPWRRTFGWRFFQMSAARGKMSAGEVIFTGFVVLSCLWAWLSRFAPRG